jgi:2-iminobutanoate/2-iminopropanoate deaminase
MTDPAVTREAMLELAKARGLTIGDEEAAALAAALSEQVEAVARTESALGDSRLEPSLVFRASWPGPQADAHGGRRRQVTSPDIEAPLFPTYSQGVVVPVGNLSLLFIAGQVAPVAASPAADELARQVRCCYAQIRTIIEAAGGRMGDLVQTTGYLTDIGHLAEVAAVRAEFVGDPPPASSVVEVAALARQDLLFELDGMAVIGAG